MTRALPKIVAVVVLLLVIGFGLLGALSGCAAGERVELIKMATEVAVDRAIDRALELAVAAFAERVPQSDAPWTEVIMAVIGTGILGTVGVIADRRRFHRKRSGDQPPRTTS